MTYTLKRYKSYEDYLNDEDLSNEINYRLLDTGEVIEVASENNLNVAIIYALIVAMQTVRGISFLQYVRNGNQEMQVPPVGDRWVNRKPDLLVLRPEHLDLLGKALFFEMPPPLFVAEVVSPGSESSDNYRRDYVWKREQYEWWQIPEYWIIDPHKGMVTVLTLVDGTYQEAVYRGDRVIKSVTFPQMAIAPDKLLTGTIEESV